MITGSWGQIPHPTPTPTPTRTPPVLQVPLYLSGIAEYSVTASMPTYVSFANRREANTTHCPNLPPLLWAFPALPPPPPRAAPSFNRAAMGATLFALRSSASRKQVRGLSPPLAH